MTGQHCGKRPNHSIAGLAYVGAGLMTALGHLQPSSAIPSDGSLSADSCRSGRMPMMAELGHSTKSLRDSGGCGLALGAVPREEIVDSERNALC